jgi:hypothetical protein
LSEALNSCSTPRDIRSFLEFSKTLAITMSGGIPPPPIRQQHLGGFRGPTQGVNFQPIHKTPVLKMDGV